ncbi:MAG: hypothetical protein LC115_12715 [Bacteroidia bacterium]|nr:hypothetical protein [Bacteroidia bacterium]
MKFLLTGFLLVFIFTINSYAQDALNQERKSPETFVGTNNNPYAPVNAERMEDRPANPVILQAEKAKAGEVFNVIQDKPEHPEINYTKYYSERNEVTPPTKPE